MKIKCFDKGIILIVLFILLFCGLTFAQEKGKAKMQGMVVKMQGIVDKVYVDKKMMRVNEELKYVWDSNTIFRNVKGSPIPIDKFKRDVWVYIEGIRDEKGKPILIQKIYLLPRRIRDEETHLYPFMQ